MRMNLDWEPFYAIEREGLPYRERLRAYAAEAERRFDAARFEEFCSKHLAHLAEVAWEFFATDEAREAVRVKTAALYPAHEVDTFTDLFWSRIQTWREQEGAQPEAVVADVPEPGEDAGLLLGPFRVRASVEARYVDADTFVEKTAEPTRDKYLEVQPRVQAATPVGAGAFTLEYAPVFRAFATYDQVNSNSHLLSGLLELPVGSRVTLRARDRFQSGVLDTRVVDPGGEYFFGLGRFNRNDADAGASIVVGPRLSVELGGSLGTVRFLEESTFFDYDTRAASAGFGFELTPTLRAVASYVYDEVPRPEERPEAESTAHNAQLSITGEILPLLIGDLSVGYRSQDTPNAGPGGQSYSGFTMSASLQREFARDVRLSIYGTRSTPLSAFESNGFYVATGVRGVLELPLVARFEARGGIGYQWSDYLTIADEIGVPREDRILGWFVGLRRPLSRQISLSAAYREERRGSNIPRFDTDADGFYLQLEWNALGQPR